MISDNTDLKQPQSYFAYVKNKYKSYEMNLGGSVRINPTGIALLCGVILLLVYLNSGSSRSETRTQPETVSLKSLLSVAISVAEAGGREVVAVRNEADIGESSKGKTREGANDPKTDGDMRSHIQMYYGLKKMFPNILIVSEEHDEKEIDLSTVETPDDKNPEVELMLHGINVDVPADDVAVWIDPLDATQEYTENLKQYVTTMVCVAVRGVPKLGIIHKPFDQKTAWGFGGQNLVSKSVSDDLGQFHSKPDMSKAKIIVSRSHAGGVEEVAKKTLGQNITVTPAGGAGYKVWEVIKGTQDAYIHTTLIKKWDICAGAAILNALGGKMTTLNGETIDFGRADQEKNEGGLLATMHQHLEFLDKLKSLKSP